MNSSSSIKWILAGVGGFLVLMLALSIWWSQEPDALDVRAITQEEAEQLGQKPMVGSTTTATLIRVVGALQDKPGGYLSNDIMPPGLLMDNMPNWEHGVLLQVRDMTRAMRDNISRSQSQSQEDADLAKAESLFNIEHTSWMMPDAQNEYSDGAEHLRSYLQRLQDDDQQNAQFYARADNLRYWLTLVEVKLGSLSQRLSASVGQKRLNTDLAGDEAAVQSTQSDNEIVAKTPWLEIDDVFYEARGSTWALAQLLKAVEIDFADVLRKKNAQVSVAQIIRELEATQQTLYSPMVLNGSGFGLFANHSLVMASYISRANAAIIDLRSLLENG
ncbi:Uncharacterised protein [BD1-7 clade bacterium]|uniref:DUF2333 domain-containing protein n=1 Tax=BD1-7 clade bacterium TaxID=2029982 RepID=A0A5S9N882_9GAMM|nr:Uncharacterised protein [BD1-7 clade bacterium]CAA0085366.1 Uncharacterised protein [BD1-7 clade bacterium]